jgi:uncharacterized membrane protein YeiH
MDDNSLTIIVGLANKLGTTADHVVSALIQKIVCQGRMDCLSAIVFGVLTAIFGGLFASVLLAMEESEAKFFCGMATLLGLIACGLFCYLSAQSAYVELHAPEGLAIEQLVQLLRH